MADTASFGRVKTWSLFTVPGVTTSEQTNNLEGYVRFRCISE